MTKNVRIAAMLVANFHQANALPITLSLGRIQHNLMISHVSWLFTEICFVCVLFLIATTLRQP